MAISFAEFGISAASTNPLYVTWLNAAAIANPGNPAIIAAETTTIVQTGLIFTQSGPFTITEPLADSDPVGTVEADGANAYSILVNGLDVNGNGVLPYAINDGGAITILDAGDLADGNPNDGRAITVGATDGVDNGTARVVINIDPAGDAIVVDQDRVAIPGVAETFLYNIDSSTGEVISTAGGDFSITDFSVGEDSIIFQDVATGTVTTVTFVDEVIISGSGIPPIQTNIIFDANAEGVTNQLTLVGINDDTLATVNFTVEN